MPDTIRLVRGPSPSAPVSNPERKDWKKKIPYLVIGLIGTLVVVLSFRWFVWTIFYVSTDNSYIQKEIYPVSSRIMGYVKSVPVSEGVQVKEGDLLVTLDDSDFRIELSFKQSKYDTTFDEVVRARKLSQTAAVSRSDLEKAEATLTANKADLDGTLAKINYTRVYSPVTGTIAKTSVQSGQFVQPGQSLVVIVKDSETWVKANIKETQIASIRPGMKAKIETDAFPGIIWTGTVVNIFPASAATLSLLPPENATGNFTKVVQNIPVKISLDKEQGAETSDSIFSQLRPGMSATTTIRIR